MTNEEMEQRASVLTRPQLEFSVAVTRTERKYAPSLHLTQWLRVVNKRLKELDVLSLNAACDQSENSAD